MKYGLVFARIVLIQSLAMNKLFLTTLTGIMIFCSALQAQDHGYDVFIPISKYMEKGDADKLSAWFSENLEVTIFSQSNNSSDKQARQIMKSFFKSYTPRSFEITHTAGRSNMKYALGTLTAGGEIFVVTIFVNYKESGYKIQQLKIEQMD